MFILLRQSIMNKKLINSEFEAIWIAIMNMKRTNTRETILHEFRANTNIKFICPRFQKVMF
jgi:hypothetical protein